MLESELFLSIPYIYFKLWHLQNMIPSWMSINHSKTPRFKISEKMGQIVQKYVMMVHIPCKYIYSKVFSYFNYYYLGFCIGKRFFQGFEQIYHSTLGDFPKSWIFSTGWLFDHMMTPLPPKCCIIPQGSIQYYMGPIST